jgi:tetratricopeptide (TPR) repeat protein
MTGDPPRRCRRCLVHLARDNDGSLCGACTSSQGDHVAGENMPPTFWHHDSILAAVADRHFGRLVKAYRHHPYHGRRPLSQELVAGWLGLSQAQLSRIENGPAPQNLDRLLIWGTRLKVPQRLLWFVAPDGDVASSFDRERAAVTLNHVTDGHVDDVLDLLRDQWHLLVRTDNLLGPRFALAGVLDHLDVLRQLAGEFRGRQRRSTVALSAQYAESASWLYEDAGDLAKARSWIDTALGWAHEADDLPLQTWALYRRSQQAAQSGDAGGAIALAEAGRRQEHDLPLPMQAALRVQEAHARALDGEYTTAQGLLDEAHERAQVDDAGDARSGHGDFCVPGFVEMHRALCLQLSGEHDSAATVYRISVTQMPPVYQRNRALALAGLAAASCAAGEPEEAVAAAAQALSVARATGSARIEQQLVAVGHSLTPYRRQPAVAAFLGELAAADA